jgi:hypothetical protein
MNENESSTSTVEARIKKLNESLDAFEHSIGLPSMPLGPDNEMLLLLNLNRQMLRSMTAEDCGENAALLQQFAFHLQRAVNREKAKLDYCVENITHIVAKTVSQQKGWKYEERLPLAIRADDVAIKFDYFRVQFQNRINRINFLAAKVENQSRRLAELGETKRRQHA